MASVTKSTTCWVVSEGIAGTENQCLGAAEALGVKYDIKRIQLRQPWKFLSPYLGLECSYTFSPTLKAPWPDIVIASGRKAIAAARYIKRASKGKTFIVQLQDPRISPKNFDLVAVPAHDPTRGANVFVTMAAPNRITPDRLSKARKEFANLKKIKGPRIAVLIGGSSKAHKMSAQTTKELANNLKSLDGGLMITASRRTGDENLKILKHALKNTDAYIWNGKGANPYFGFLAWADYILVTADSVSMLSEAGTTGKPVYMIPLEGGAKRLDLFHNNLLTNGTIRNFKGKLENWNSTPLNDAQKVAGEIIKRLKNR